MNDKFYNTELLRGGDAFDIEYSKERNVNLFQLCEEEREFQKEELKAKIKQVIYFTELEDLKIHIKGIDDYLGKIFECLKYLKRNAKRSMRYLNEQSILFQIQDSLHAIETDKLIGHEGNYINPIDGKKIQYKIVSDYTVWSTSSVDEDMREKLLYEDGILLKRDGKEILINIEEIEDID